MSITIQNYKAWWRFGPLYSVIAVHLIRGPLMMQKYLGRVDYEMDCLYGMTSNVYLVWGRYEDWLVNSGNYPLQVAVTALMWDSTIISHRHCSSDLVPTLPLLLLQCLLIWLCFGVHFVPSSFPGMCWISSASVCIFLNACLGGSYGQCIVIFGMTSRTFYHLKIWHSRSHIMVSPCYAFLS